MSSHTLSQQQLAALAALAATSARKAKTSVTLSGNLLKVIDGLAGASQRSAWIERAVRAYARRELRRERRVRELELLNRHAKALNAEGDESAEYQSAWDGE
jgi:metal-responsive CopG/Arc/MetJ family transcriptional regulator